MNNSNQSEQPTNQDNTTPTAPETTQASTKLCSRCKTPQPLNSFNADSRRIDGKRSTCKDCDSKHKKVVRDANIDTYRERNRENNRRYRERKRLGGQ